MKNIIISGAVSLCPLAQAVTVTFEDLSPAQVYSGGGFFENGLNDTPSFQSGPLTFETGYSPDFGGYWETWAYSSTSDSTTPGIANQYSAYPGSGVDSSSTYVVGNSFSSSFGFSIPSDYDLQSLQLAITTYSALYILSGDNTFGTGGRAFGGDLAIDDLLQVEISALQGGLGFGSPILVDLADSTNPTDFGISNTWINVDLSALATADELQFRLINTQGGVASYFALDNIELAAVPEPSTGLLGLASIALLARRRRP